MADLNVLLNMVKISSRFKKIALPSVLLLFVISLFWAFSKEERDRFDSPDGKYTAIILAHRHTAYTFVVFPGSGSDYSCFLSIYERETGRHMGTAPVFTAGHARGVVWQDEGAYIDLRPGPEWDFKNRTCIYYDSRDNQVSGL